jgi:hypothetical protein
LTSACKSPGFRSGNGMEAESTIRLDPAESDVAGGLLRPNFGQPAAGRGASRVEV